MQRVRAQSDTAQTVFTARACDPDAAAACDVFAEYKLHSQSSGVRSPYLGSLTLYSDGSFSIHHAELAGGGDYTVAGSTVVFNYTDKFLLELSAEYDVWSSYSTVEETGSMSENLISLRRCMTEDCYESTWVYQRTGSP